LLADASDKQKSIALSKFPNKTQQEVANHVGCSQGYVAKIAAELIPSNKLAIPATRKGKDGKTSMVAAVLGGATLSLPKVLPALPCAAFFVRFIPATASAQTQTKKPRR